MRTEKQRCKVLPKPEKNWKVPFGLGLTRSRTRTRIPSRTKTCIALTSCFFPCTKVLNGNARRIVDLIPNVILVRILEKFVKMVFLFIFCNYAIVNSWIFWPRDEGRGPKSLKVVVVVLVLVLVLVVLAPL